MTKMLSASGGLCPLTPWPGALTPVIYRFVLRTRHGAPPTTDPFRCLCLSLGLSASISPRNYMFSQSSPMFLRTLFMAVDRISSCGVAVYYVFPVLWSPNDSGTPERNWYHKNYYVTNDATFKRRPFVYITYVQHFSWGYRLNVFDSVEMRVFLSSIILAQTPPQSFFEVKYYFRNI